MLEGGGKREIEWGVGFVLTTEWVGSKSFVKSLLCGWVVRKWRMLECVKVWRRRVRANNVFSAHLRSFSLWDRESTAYARTLEGLFCIDKDSQL